MHQKKVTGVNYYYPTQTSGIVTFGKSFKIHAINLLHFLDFPFKNGHIMWWPLKDAPAFFRSPGTIFCQWQGPLVSTMAVARRDSIHCFFWFPPKKGGQVFGISRKLRTIPPKIQWSLQNTHKNQSSTLTPTAYYLPLFIVVFFPEWGFGGEDIFCEILPSLSHL